MQKFLAYLCAATSAALLLAAPDAQAATCDDLQSSAAGIAISSMTESRSLQLGLRRRVTLIATRSRIIATRSQSAPADPRSLQPAQTRYPLRDIVNVTG